MIGSPAVGRFHDWGSLGWLPGMEMLKCRVCRFELELFGNYRTNSCGVLLEPHQGNQIRKAGRQGQTQHKNERRPRDEHGCKKAEPDYQSGPALLTRPSIKK